MDVKIYRTSKADKKLFEEVKPLTNKVKTSSKIVLNPLKTYQTLIGFGGALTPASQETLDLMSLEDRRKVLESVFSKDGLNYSLIRMSINSCDFSSEVYDYLNGTKDLANFSLEKEERLIRYISEIRKIHDGELTFVASPWSAPSYMKTNNNMLDGGKLKKEYYLDWATYFALYLKGMKSLGVDVNYVTIQNEPEAHQTWESMLYTKEEEKDFCYNYLVPVFEKNKIETKILVWDHNKDHAYERAKELFSEDNPYVVGLAYHWYCSKEFENISKVHESFPNKHIFFTEGCVELVNKCLHGVLFDFKNGEVYGNNYINGLNSFTEAFIDWNMILNELGGPNHVGNYCESPIMYDRKTKQVIYNTSYYFIKHFSHFLDKGDVRIECQFPSSILATAFKKKDSNQIVLIVQNETEVDEIDTICLNNSELVIEVVAHSIQTIIIDN